MRALGAIIGGLLVLVAIGIALQAGAANALFWMRANAGNTEAQVIGVSMSITATVCKLAIPVWFAVVGLRWRERKKLLAVWVLALIFDTWSGVSYNGMARTDAAETRRLARSDADAARRELPTLRKQLEALEPARPAGHLPSVIAEQERVAGACPPSRTPSDACKELAKLRVEYSAATTRDKLQGQIDAAEARATKVQAETSADGRRQQRPEVTAFAKALQSAGIAVDLDALDTIWAVLWLTLVELAPVAVLAEVLRKAAPPTPGPTHDVASVAPDTPAPQITPRPRAVRQPQRFDASAAIDALPVRSDGWRELSQRDVASRYNTSAATIGRAVNALVASGQLEKRSTSRGTLVRRVTN